MSSFLNGVRFSTNYDPKLTLENLFREYEIAYEDGTIEYRRDYIGNDLVRFIKRIPDYSAKKYDGATPFTTLVYQIYGTTTATYVVMMYNGLHPLEIIPGTVIKFPDLTTLIDRFQRRNQLIDNIGKTTLV